MSQKLIVEETTGDKSTFVVATHRLVNRNEVIEVFRDLINSYFAAQTARDAVLVLLRDLESDWIIYGRVHHETLSSLLAFEDEFRKRSDNNPKLTAGQVRALIYALKEDLAKEFETLRRR